MLCVCGCSKANRTVNTETFLKCVFLILDYIMQAESLEKRQNTLIKICHFVI